MKLLKRAAVGLLLGAALGAVILWSVGTPGSPGPILLHLLAAGLYGASCMGGTLLYEIERWPLLKSTVLHWLITALLFAPIALLLGWVDGLPALLIMEGIVLAGFLLIWLIIYLRCKAQVRELNELLKKTNEKAKRVAKNRKERALWTQKS